MALHSGKVLGATNCGWHIPESIRFTVAREAVCRQRATPYAESEAILEFETMWRWIGAIAAAAVLAVLAMGGGARQAPAAGATKTAIFAGGCFWCVEAAFDEVPGVTETVSGYAGGTKPNPTYGDHEGYQEAVKVTYDPAKVTYAQLLDTYWLNIDPFDANGQFCDQGNAYRSVIFYGNHEEKGLAESTEKQIADRFKETVATEIKPVTTFTSAEDYHQNYHNVNPVSYKFYKWNCGRAQRLEQLWGPKPS
jgi:peptide-methionine (S)-S-oxide reductase